MLRVLLLTLLISCQSIEKAKVNEEKGSSPPTPKIDEGQREYEAAEKLFTQEVDACFAVYRDCRKTASDSVCFPPHEQCVILAYRKLKRAKEKHDAGKSLLH